MRKQRNQPGAGEPLEDRGEGWCPSESRSDRQVARRSRGITFTAADIRADLVRIAGKVLLAGEDLPERARVRIRAEAALLELTIDRVLEGEDRVRRLTPPELLLRRLMAPYPNDELGADRRRVKELYVPPPAAAPTRRRLPAGRGTT